MSNINNFVKYYDCDCWGYIVTSEGENYQFHHRSTKTFKELMEEYNELKENITETKEIIKEYEDRLRKNEIPTFQEYKKNSIFTSRILFEYLSDLEKKTFDTANYDFTKQVALSAVIDYLIYDRKEEEFLDKKIDLTALMCEIEYRFAELRNYMHYKLKLENLLGKKRVLLENIHLHKISSYQKDCLQENHYFIKLKDELRCVYCGFSTKEFNLNSKELDFLTDLINDKHLLLEFVNENDLPIIEVIRKKQEYNISKNQPNWDRVTDLDLEYTEEDESDWENYRHLVEDAPLSMQLEINRAHMIDGKITKKTFPFGYGEVRTNEQKYLTDLQAKELLETVNKDLENAKSLSDDVKAKELFIEMCNVRKYEILILAGKHIPSLYYKLDDEFEKECLAKAYFNLSKQSYRKASGYFNELDAYFHDILTADPEVNKKILEMRVR